MSRSQNRPWMIRLAYSMPLINGIVFLILGFIPHLFYISGNNNPPTLSPFGLLGIIRESGVDYVTGRTAGSTVDFYFYTAMLALWALSALCIAFYAILVVSTTAMLPSVWSPQNHPTVQGNKLKRIYRIAVPNRVFFVFYQLLPIVPTIFPYLFQLLCKRMLGQTMKVYYYGIPDWIVVMLLTAASVSLFLTSLRSQKSNKMDLFRIYKTNEP